MSTWADWQNEFLLAAGIIDTPPNRDFLTEWARHASSPQCRDNPIDLHAKVGGSTNCDHPAGSPNWTQAYTSHAHAASAFKAQIHSPFASVILAALQSGNPWQLKDWQDVVGQLRQWPSVNFATWFESNHSGGGGGGGGGGGKAARAHSGWSDLRRTLNKHLPKALRTSQHNTAAALRSLSRSRKVRL